MILRNQETLDTAAAFEVITERQVQERARLAAGSRQTVECRQFSLAGMKRRYGLGFSEVLGDYTS